MTGSTPDTADPFSPTDFEGATDNAAGQGSTSVLDPTCNCARNWIKIRYEYEDGTGVPGANYIVQTVTGDATGQVLAQGTTDANGDAHEVLPDEHTSVEFYFFDDPEGEPYEDPEADAPLAEPEPGFWARLWDNISEAGDWVWGIIQGDFNEDASTSQIIARMILTMIPGIDQLADVQDIINVLYKLIWKQEWNVLMNWVLLVITLIGLIPVLGSLAKGLLKLIIRKAGDISALRSLYGICNFFNKMNAHRWLRDFASKLTGEHLQAALNLLDEMMTRVAAYMAGARSNFLFRSWNRIIDDGLAKVASFRLMAPAKLREAAEYLQQRLLQTLAVAMTRLQRAGTRNTEPHVIRQGVEEPPTRGPYGGTDGTTTGPASGRTYDPENVGGPIRRSDWRNANIDSDGIHDVRTHVNRFEEFAPNEHMIDRLERIERGELVPTDYDLRYYTHEMRELERYRNLGIPDGADAGYDIWQDVHAATLEDYGLSDFISEGDHNLYHPDAWALQ